jgi:hypothetical protein
MRYKPSIGSEFEVISAKTKYLTELTRSTIALCFVLVSSFGLIFAAVVGALKGDFGYLSTLWAVIAAPLGGIVGFYFRGQMLHGQKDDESTA